MSNILRRIYCPVAFLLCLFCNANPHTYNIYIYRPDHSDHAVLPQFRHTLFQAADLFYSSAYFQFDLTYSFQTFVPYYCISAVLKLFLIGKISIVYPNLPFLFFVNRPSPLLRGVRGNVREYPLPSSFYARRTCPPFSPFRNTSACNPEFPAFPARF